MKLQLIHGTFPAKDASALITELIKVKIKYHEDRIHNGQTEEDIKAREAKIKRLHHELDGLREYLNANPMSVELEAEIQIN